MDKVYLVQHSYENEGNEETKFIGIFSSTSTAQKAIDELSVKLGFSSYPKESFSLEEVNLDEYEWKEGFIKWEDA